MIFMTCHYGLANRLFYFAHCLALAEATGHTLVSLNMPEAGESFNGRHGAFCVWPKTSPLGLPWPRPVRRVAEAVYRRNFPTWQRLFRPAVFEASIREPEATALANEDFVARVRAARWVVMRGWLSIEDIVLPEPEKIRAFFAPPPWLAQRCQQFAARARGGAENVLVGIHCRWGDYSRYGDGCFYYPAQSYARVMHHCVSLFPGQQVRFLLISNEPDKLERERNCFASLDFSLGPSGLVEDLFTLAECDYVVCPASSYSLWAAFQGRKPVWCMQDAETLPGREDFQICDHTFRGMHPEGEIRVAGSIRRPAGVTGGLAT